MCTTTFLDAIRFQEKNSYCYLGVKDLFDHSCGGLLQILKVNDKWILSYNPFVIKMNVTPLRVNTLHKVAFLLYFTTIKGPMAMLEKGR